MEAMRAYKANSDFIDLLSLSAAGGVDPDIKIRFDNNDEFKVILNILAQVEIIELNNDLKFVDGMMICFTFSHNKFKAKIEHVQPDSMNVISVGEFIALYCYGRLNKKIKKKNIPASNNRPTSCHQPVVDTTKNPPPRKNSIVTPTLPNEEKVIKYAYFNIRARSAYGKGSIKTIVIKGDSMLSALTRYYNNLDILKMRGEPISCILAKNVFDNLK